jgi:hypothetical protein
MVESSNGVQLENVQYITSTATSFKAKVKRCVVGSFNCGWSMENPEELINLNV